MCHFSYNGYSPELDMCVCVCVWATILSWPARVMWLCLMNSFHTHSVIDLLVRDDKSHLPVNSWKPFRWISFRRCVELNACQYNRSQVMPWNAHSFTKSQPFVDPRPSPFRWCRYRSHSAVQHSEGRHCVRYGIRQQARDHQPGWGHASHRLSHQGLRGRSTQDQPERWDTPALR